MKTSKIVIALAVFISSLPLFAQDAGTNATPQIPEEARRHEVIGTTLFKDAKTPDDYSQATTEFKQAADLAPQWPEARYNLALAKEAAGDYSGAEADLKLYLQFKLSDDDARKAQDKIYVMEAKGKKAADLNEVQIAEQYDQVIADVENKFPGLIERLNGKTYKIQSSVYQEITFVERPLASEYPVWFTGFDDGSYGVDTFNLYQRRSHPNHLWMILTDKDGTHDTKQMVLPISSTQCAIVGDFGPLRLPPNVENVNFVASGINHYLTDWSARTPKLTLSEDGSVLTWDRTNPDEHFQWNRQ